MSRLIDLTGQRFGKLVVVERAENNKRGQARWLCECDCGGTSVVNSVDLKSGNTRSCGCIKKESIGNVNKSHGMTDSSEYKSWCTMKQRCHNKNNHKYPMYGGRGIKICSRWLKSFQNFYDDMGPRPSPKHSIDRINNDGDYTPDNCRWATPKQQSNNRRSNVLLTYKGKTKNVSQWAEEFGLPQVALRLRLVRYNWSIEKALTTPLKKSA